MSVPTPRESRHGDGRKTMRYALDSPARRWLVAVAVALAGFGGCWLGLEASHVLDAGPDVGIAAVPLVTTLAVLGSWAERARKQKSAKAQVSAEVKDSPLGQAIGRVEGGINVGPGASFSGAVFNLPGRRGDGESSGDLPGGSSPTAPSPTVYISQPLDYGKDTSRILEPGEAALPRQNRVLADALAAWSITDEWQKAVALNPRRSEAKVVLDRYRGPLLDAAWQLGDRLDSIRHRGFLAYLAEGSGRERDAKLTTLFRFAHYFGWREVVRTEVQLLRFEKEEDTRSAAGFLDDVAEVLASDLLDGKWAMLWNDEQRGIGELMTERPSGAASIVRGHAAFHRDYDKTFAPWMERFAGDLLSPAALKSDRLRLLQRALYGLVRQLDEEGTYGGVWIDRSASEIRLPPQHGGFTQHEEKLRRHLAAIEPSTSSLP